MKDFVSILHSQFGIAYFTKYRKHFLLNKCCSWLNEL